jgi:hypothetical protein
MPRVKYVGPHDAVDLVGVGTVKRGAMVDVPAALAKSLTEQADWTKVAPRKPPKKKAAQRPAPTPPLAGDKNEE